MSAAEDIPSAPGRRALSVRFIVCNAGIGCELNVITAVIIGVLVNDLILIGLSGFMRQVITGVVSLIVVILDHYRARYSAL